jgi:hypothetical protein
MELITTGFSTAVILLFVTLIIASAGLVLFILGLILKKPGQWVPGIILSVVALILGIYSLGIFFTSIGQISYRTNDYSNYDFNDPNSNNGENNGQAPEANKDVNNDESSSRVSGHIQDDDHSLIYIKVFPAPELYDMGIKVTKIDTYNGSGKDKKVIPLEINFENKFKGNLQMILFSAEDVQLGSSDVQINQEGKTTFTVKFVFDKTANFLQTDHARLKTSD